MLDLWTETTTNLLAIIATSGVISGLTTTALDYWWRRRSEWRSTQYLAVRIAHLLEDFANDCALKAAEHEVFDWSGHQIGQRIKLLLPPVLPEEDTYRLIDPNLLSQILAIPQTVKQASRETEHFSEAGHNESADIVAMVRTIQVGLNAAKSSTELRKSFYLKSRHLNYGDTTVEEYLQKQLERWQGMFEKIDIMNFQPLTEIPGTVRK